MAGASGAGAPGSGSYLIFGFGDPIARFDFDAAITSMGFLHNSTSPSKTLRITAGGTVTDLLVTSPTGASDFFGIAFDAAVTSVRIANITGAGNINIDDLRTSVPGPATLPLLSLALLGLNGSKRSLTA
jgi:hypothetical protein